MVMVEGSGMIAPGRVDVRLPPSDVEYLRSAAAERDRFRNYSARSDRWGIGYVPNAIMCGMMGEHALCTFLNRSAGCRLSIDASLKKNGDGGKDVVTDGLVIQVKTRGIKSQHNLIRRLDNRKRLRKAECDLYVFARLSGARDVQLLGWISSDDARQHAEFLRSRVDTHWNLRVPDERLLPMSRLADQIKLARMTWRDA